MKKAILAAGLLLLSCNAYAYDNYSDGYIIKGKAPAVTINAENLYGYNNIVVKDDKNSISSAHFITSLDAQETERYLGEVFTTKYFDMQYDKLSLLKRSELSLQTIPIDLTDLDKYVDNTTLNSVTINNLRYRSFNGADEDIQPLLRIDKIGKYKTITSTYFLKQLDIPYIINTTFISVQDRLYILSSNYSELSLDDKSIASKGKALSKEELSAKPVRKIDVEEDLINHAWEDHKKFIKSFKAVPVKNLENNFGYEDQITKQRIDLPKDWLYQSTMLQDNSVNKGQITMAMPVSMLYNLSNDETAYNLACDLFEKLTFADDNNNDILTTAQAQQAILQNQDDIIGFGNAVFKNITSLFVAASFETKEAEFKVLTDRPLETNLSVTALLEDGFNYLASKQNNYFAVNSYHYDIDFADKKGKIDIIADTDYFKDNNHETRLKFICDNKNKGSIVLFLGKYTDTENYNKISDIINKWQF